jgi:hypothetical protein
MTRTGGSKAWWPTSHHLFTASTLKALYRLPAYNTFGKTLYAGYSHELRQALHILMPQFEHIVRKLLPDVRPGQPQLAQRGREWACWYRRMQQPASLYIW